MSSGVPVVRFLRRRTNSRGGRVSDNLVLQHERIRCVQQSLKGQEMQNSIGHNDEAIRVTVLSNGDNRMA